MVFTKSEQMHMKWLSSLPQRVRNFRAPHIFVLAIISTLLIVAIMRDHLLWVLGTLTGYAAATAASSSGQVDETMSSLSLSSDDTFKISIFEDLHFGEEEDTDWGPRQDTWTVKVMQDLLKAENPQLVVLNGDLITGENTYLENATDYLDMIVKPIMDGGYQWASAYGNHDQNYNLSTQALYEKERAYGSSSLTGRMVFGQDVGTSNYFLYVYGSVNDAVPSLILWFFDSQGGRRFQQHDSTGKEIPVDGLVHPDVVDWFQQTSRRIQSYYPQTIPSLAFVHIPVSTMLEAQKDGVDEHREPGINEDKPVASQGPDDSSFINALANTEGLLAVFSGHDHGNDFCVPYQSNASSGKEGTPFFCFGRHTGYGGYGHWSRGSRQVFFDRSTFSMENPSLETWIRLEDNSISGHVFLNSTYGVDFYPEASHKETHLPPNDP
jgi:hypothetical protein